MAAFGTLVCTLAVLVALSNAVHFIPVPTHGVDSIPRGKPLTPTRHYDTSATRVEGKLNVHIVPHTHDDVGWLKTVDEYFMGSNNSIQDAGVQYILDSVVLSLAENPNRKFIYVEIAFFKRWWDEQTPDKQAQVRSLVASGQLTFINGGWCMSDEAAPYYVDMVDQQTLGHQFLLKNFGRSAIPKIGWQIDPFGHSSAMATLYALMGMDAWYFGRADYQDRSVREGSKNCETVMRPSRSLGSTVNIFTGLMRGYGAPGGFDFNSGSWDAPIQDDPRLEDMNVQSRVDDFVKAALDLASVTRGNDIIFTMGSDFEYENANTWYKNLDKLIHYVNQDGRVNALYSNPYIYTQAKYNANLTWTAKDDDWFPYADSAHAFWTGYFTSRPALKGYVRSSSALLQACRQLEAQVDTKETSQAFWEAMGLAQHHDGVSGTEKQHVAYDYARHLSVGETQCLSLMSDALGGLMTGKTGSVQFTYCPYLNESICAPTTTIGRQTVVVYNQLGQPRKPWVRVPIGTSQTAAVADASGAAVQVDLVPSGVEGTQTAVFQVSLPAMGYATYVLTVSSAASAAPRKPAPQLGDSTIENEIYQVSFDASGRISQITNKISGVSTKLTQDWGWYNASDGNTAPDQRRGQASGAYIFRPNCTENVPTPCDPFEVNTGDVTLTITRGAGVQQAMQLFADWVTQTVRLYRNASYIEVEYTVGPVPVKDGLGKEVVTRWLTDLASGGVAYTDSNGRDMQERIINYRPTWKLNVTDPVSGNYYPVNSAIYIEDSTRRFTIITDRSQGGASLGSGRVELMPHRRLLHDDDRGVGEPLNEPGTNGKGLIVTATQRIILDTPAKSPALHRTNQQHLNFAPVAMFAPYASIPRPTQPIYSGVKSVLPANIHLLTVMDNSAYGTNGTLLVRLAHLFEAGEDPVLSRPSTVDITTLFSALKVSACTEMSLTANQRLSDVQRKQFPIAGEETGPATRQPDPANAVTVNPMEIRTFSCTYTNA